MSTGSASAAAIVGAAPKVSPIDSAITTLTNAQSETHDLISSLFSRLAPVLPPVEVKPASGPEPEPAGESPLHTELLKRIEYARGHNRRLVKIIDELTL